MKAFVCVGLVGLSSLAAAGCGKGDAGAGGDGAAGPVAVDEPGMTAAPKPGGEVPTGPAGLLDRSPADDWGGDKRLRLVLRGVEARSAAGGTQLVFEVEARDGETGKALDALDPEAIALTLDGRYVPGKYEVQTFREAGRAIALGLLLPSHKSYVQEVEGDDPVWRPVDGLMEGAATIMRQLQPQDRVAIFGLTEEGMTVVAPWGTPEAARERVPALPVASGSTVMAPHLYASLGKVLDSFQENDADLPARRVLMTVSDGLDPLADKASALQRRLGDLVERAMASGAATPWAIGFTLAMDEPLVNLEELVQKAGGRYAKVSVEQRAQLDDRMAEMAAEIDDAFVVTLTPAAGVRLPKSAAEVGVALRAPGGAAAGRATGGGITIAR
ncbi:MAG: hypothetical protein IT385_08025 [Deltaproteobacteria bacterium]|nr:hypothetical protein [Deltaproteobacteria bacterium]